MWYDKDWYEVDGVCADDAGDHVEWRFRTSVACAALDSWKKGKAGEEDVSKLSVNYYKRELYIR